ncbi:MAG: alanine racemase [Planctomycetota bacterium]|nr:MAG: alanine racemase [Planctomycetota bacterium]
MSHYRAWAEIDLDAFRRNLRLAKRAAGAAQVWPVLKANAYGHGAPQLARACAEEGVRRVGVGDSTEALELRECGVRAPILVLGTVIDAEVPDLLRHDIEVGVHSESRVRKLGEEARRAGRRLGVHLKIDTGMGRLGVRPEAALRVATAVLNEPFLDLRGLMTHFAPSAGARDPFLFEQLGVFQDCHEELRAEDIRIPTVHYANSAALFTHLRPLGGAVRPGIALYGVLPAELAASERAEPALAAGLEPVLSLRTQVVFLKDVPAGTAVGYNSRWCAQRPTRIATLPIGYCDGLPYGLGVDGRGQVLVRGRRCALVGAVSMDYCTADVTDVAGAAVGDSATLVGVDGSERLRLEDLAAAAGTIPYEISCTLGRRVRRIYREALTEARTRVAAAS